MPRSGSVQETQTGAAPSGKPPVNPTSPPVYNNGNPKLPLNPATARNTDSCVPLNATEAIRHEYTVAGGEPAPGGIGFRWMYGSPIAALDRDPRIQVIAYNDDTLMLRQNVCVHWEAPFTYLIFGNKGALLIDTGATANLDQYPLRATVDRLIENWAQARRRKVVPLTVLLTSGEDIAQNQGLAQFRGRPNTTIVPPKLADLQRFFAMQTNWPAQAAPLDLGDRVLQVLPTPGTHQDGVSIYDPYTHLLFTGDLLYPGKIQIANDKEYIASLERLLAFRETHPIKWIVGGHIEMQFLPGKAYPRFYTYKPYERVLELPPTVIDDALQTARSIVGQQTVVVRPDFWLLNRVSPDQKTSVFPANLPNINAPRPF